MAGARCSPGVWPDDGEGSGTPAPAHSHSVADCDLENSKGYQSSEYAFDTRSVSRCQTSQSLEVCGYLCITRRHHRTLDEIHTTVTLWQACAWRDVGAIIVLLGLYGEGRGCGLCATGCDMLMVDDSGFAVAMLTLLEIFYSVNSYSRAYSIISSCVIAVLARPLPWSLNVRHSRT